MGNNIGYHTRLYSDPTVKVVGGSFGGDLSMETVERLLKAHKYSVRISETGHPRFVDKFGREVWLYFTIDPSKTSIGKEAMKTYTEQLRSKEEEEERKRQEIEDILDSMSSDEILAKLRS